MVVDSIIFFNELDMLELRLSIMADHVDRIVIVESDHTFTNIKKPYFFEENVSKFSKWIDKIVYLKVNSPCFDDPWMNESWSRDMLKSGWYGLEDNDVIIMSDVDEIVRPETINYIKNTSNSYYGLIMPVSYYKFNYVDVLSDQVGYVAWAGAYRGYHNSQPSSLRKFREYKKDYIFLHHAGWHFSWMGNDEALYKKLKSFSHTEVDIPEIEDNLKHLNFIMNNKIDHIRSDRMKYSVVDLDSYFPEYILNNKEKYKDFILPDTGEKVLDHYKFEILQLQR